MPFQFIFIFNFDPFILLFSDIAYMTTTNSSVLGHFIKTWQTFFEKNTKLFT